MVDFSVVIPHLNRPDLLRETITSVMKQTHRSFECIIVDDGSSDSNFDLANGSIVGDDRFRIFRRAGTKSGANVCRNEGARYANGEYLIFLDSDDLLSIDCLSNRFDSVDKLPGKDIYIFSMGRFSSRVGDDESLVNRHVAERNSSVLLRSFLMFDLPWPITSTLWRREFFLSILFDEKLDRFQDVDVHIHALSLSRNIALYPSVKIDCYYRKSSFHSNASRESLLRVLRNGFYIIEKWSGRLGGRERVYLMGLLLFLSRTYTRVISGKEVLLIFDTFRRLDKKWYGNFYGIICCLASWRRLSYIPGIEFLRQRAYFFSRQRYLSLIRDSL